MTIKTEDDVVLPDGRHVSISHTQQKWWTQDNASGYVSPELLAPDPDQPRKHIGDGDLEELLESVKTIGVRESITVTPRSKAPWERVAREYAAMPFVIVSGHRRLTAARKANLPAVPIKVRVYASEAEHRLEASILNESRKDLSPLEEGIEFSRLRAAGMTFEAICKTHGKAAPFIYGRLFLLQLHPDVQERINPKLPEKSRLPITVASALGAVKTPTPDELDEVWQAFEVPKSVQKEYGTDPESLTDDERRFALQLTLVAVITERALTSLQAVEFIKERTLKFRGHGKSGGRTPERYQPSKRRDVLSNFARDVRSNVVNDWKPEEIFRILGPSMREDVEDLLADFKKAEGHLTRVVGILERIRDSKRPTHPAALEILRQRKTVTLT
ncbi:MAG: ParB/RepB/Spo0J family partition protein [Minisyncoccia bacterium]